MAASRAKRGIPAMLAAAFAWSSVAAHAEPAGASGPPIAQKNHYDGNYVIVAAGVVVTPDYEGSRHSTAIPVVAAMGRIGPVGFSPRAAGLAFDVLPRQDGRRLTFSLGPVGRYQTNRHRVEDPVVARLGKLPGTAEVGVNAGVSLHRLITRYDALSLSGDIRWDVSGHHAGRIVSASLGYYTPLSRGVLVGASGSADFVDRRYARYNYDVTPAGSAASGLPVYVAHGGNKAVGVQGIIVVDLDGNLADGGPALLAGVSWNRLKGSAAETPITALRGKTSQLTFGGGLGWSF